MNGFFKKAGLGVALAATALTAAAPADAQRWGGYRHYNRGGGDAVAGALIGGVLGLGIGAAIASSNRPRYYDRGYYYDAPPPPPRVVYEDRYYAPPPPPPPPRVVVRERYYNYNYPSYGYGYGY
ncbi:hypothetical protein DC429_02450 [Arthrobacter sp. TPD3018]|jgi:hypothetical protein|uniref:hypothetical protein n=1 Tax=Bacteria TaxID=2 RepID=UPI000D5248E4|nr:MULTISPECIES: hypothetical protein [Bacteria]PVE59287.1 hypothetical protein DC425_02445 [Sphingomonas sp. TPD3009]PVE60809.1 hypothetical protein DC429_02450 [Arthrobacter sp. TPD3018]PVE87487.1 hypothetical protein DC431_02445 [Sphingomonas melonis]RTL19932.1 MAG: hypothetical protein EKK50_05495 [Sphingomonadaceae bacterium]